jgi:hypothetical protein
MTLPPPDLADLQVDLVLRILTKIDESSMPGSPGGRRKPVKKIRNFSGLMYWTASNTLRDRCQRERRWAEQTALGERMNKIEGWNL